MMTTRRVLVFVAVILAQAAFGILATARAQLITLPANEITVLDYTGQETFHDLNTNGVADTGDFFDGIFRFNSIRNAAGTVDLSSQLATRELTAQFRFSVVGGSSGPPLRHIEFDLLPTDFIRLFVGTDATRNYDETASDAVARATDGQPWLSVLPGTFFESVNDPVATFPPPFITFNRAWMDVTENNTGYGLASLPFRTLLGQDAIHTFQGETHGDHVSEAVFNNRVSGFSTIPGFTFNIFGSFSVEAVPEPSSLTLAGLAGLSLLGYSWRRAAGAKPSCRGDGATPAATPSH
jgi:hypothetical protein